jgi:hypothetical protein
MADIRTAPLLQELEHSRQLFDDFIQAEFAALAALRDGAETTKANGLSKYRPVIGFAPILGCFGLCAPCFFLKKKKKFQKKVTLHSSILLPLTMASFPYRAN